MVNFLVKWILNGIVVVPLLMLYAGVSFSESFVAATLLVVVAYGIGDQFIFRYTNNGLATVADFILACAVLWLAAVLTGWDLSAGEITVIAVILGITEYFYHRYFLRENVFGGL
ncbi:hypothetical protein PACILC2_47200 [Paenibacillus cisolokensis]|uniref:DUF2512 family protein n=1 Tax=Paenibacillus cisolokensis TaxID=1658519 RepID=A0ABQ4ND47_9BACL|nr:DUF2512 family protein [Paenibacillus cisolokensis]GIQ66152.1 hypothetical protein PACILC2_47200 [Paenibacillus cisolokensis]